MDRGNGQVRLNSLGHNDVIILVTLDLSLVKAPVSINNLFNQSLSSNVLH